MLVPEEEAPQEEDLNGDTMVEDEGSFRSDAGVSSTVVSPESIPILAPVRGSRLCPAHLLIMWCSSRISSRPPGSPKSFHLIFPMLHARHWCCLLLSPECHGLIS